MRAIMFGAYYCGYCARYWDEIVEPLLDEGFDVQYVDAMKRPVLAEKYGVHDLPNVVILSDGGHLQFRLTGKPDQEQIRRLMKG